MRKLNNPIRFLKNAFPWPSERPGVPEMRERWFSPKKQILLREVVPRDATVVVELGSWLGDSTKWFLQHCEQATVIAVDTWLGSTEHLIKRRKMLPVLYETFLANCWEFRDRLIPFRNTSLAALNLLHQIGLQPDGIYFDSDHSYWGIRSELQTAFELFPNAGLFGDDYTGGRIAEAIDDACEHAIDDCDCAYDFVDVKHLNNTWYVVKELWK